MDIIKSIEHEQLKNKIPELKVGNTVRVHVRIPSIYKTRNIFRKESTRGTYFRSSWECKQMERRTIKKNNQK